MHSMVFSCALKGVSCFLVEVEVDVSPGMPCFSIVGLGDVAVQEAKERVRSALKNSGVEFPTQRKTVNLAPADVRKNGPAFDLPIALGVAAGGRPTAVRIKDEAPSILEEAIVVGELALDGSVRGVEGVLIMALFAKENGFKRIVVPSDNIMEAGLVEGLEVVGVSHLRELVGKDGRGTEKAPSKSQERIGFCGFRKDNADASRNPEKEDLADMKDILGQDSAKRALMIAAAGRHNVLFSGPPGSGKTCLARAFQGVLAEMRLEEKLEVSKVYSAAGLLSSRRPLVEQRPFRAVHHTASRAALVGGGSKCAPGEISLAHKGVLFLDEIAEFPSHVLEALRQPMEDKQVTISRAHGSYTYPADFILLGAMNPCPCGFYGDTEKQCVCTTHQISRYQNKISGPLLDRIDVFVELPRVEFKQLSSGGRGMSSAETRMEIANALNIQLRRQGKSNGELSGAEVKTFCNVSQECNDVLERAMKVMNLSPRGYFRTLKLSRTIADFAGGSEILVEHISEALQYRRVAY